MSTGWQPLGFLSWELFCEKRLQKDAIEVETTVKLRENGRPNKNNNSDNYQSLGKDAGTSAIYLKARIARDRPDILDDMKAGKYKSVRAAAIDAGIIEPKQRYQLSDDPVKAGRYHWPNRLKNGRKNR